MHFDTPDDVKALVGNRIFSVKFKKKTTGEWRTLTGTLNLDSRLTGGGKPAIGRVVAFDVHKKQVRSFYPDSIAWIRVRGITFYNPKRERG